MELRSLMLPDSAWTLLVVAICTVAFITYIYRRI